MNNLIVPVLLAAVLSFNQSVKNPGSTPVGQGNKSITGGGTGLEPMRLQGANSYDSAKSTIAINAIQKAYGSVSGKVNYDWRGGDFKIKAEVKCVTFTGNIAKVTSVITEVAGSDASIAKYGSWGYKVGKECVISVQDNGKDEDKFSDVYPYGCNGRTNAPYIKVSGNFTIK